jgi:hypothetical protein
VTCRANQIKGAGLIVLAVTIGWIVSGRQTSEAKTAHRIEPPRREVVGELAKERGLDVVEAFPSAATPKEERSPKISQLTLQTPDLIPLYLNPELDLTTEVIARLNERYPPEKEGQAGKVNRRNLRPVW